MERLEDCISFLVGKAAQQVTRRARELLAPHGITPVQYAVLKALDGREGLSGAELSQRLVLDSASITGVVDRLEAAGLIERRADPGDRRIHRVHATARARVLQPAVDASMDRLNREAALLLEGEGTAALAGLRRLGDREGWE